MRDPYHRPWRDWAPLPLRVALGAGMIYHGWPKLFSTQGHQGFVGMLQGLGVPSPGAMGWVVGAVEFFGGIGLLLGAFVTLVAGLMIVEMLVAIALVHRSQGFSFIHITGMGPGGPTFGLPGWETPLVYLAGLLALALGGAGLYSIDRIRDARTARTTPSGANRP